jgi:hypothetical protein
VFSLWIPFHRNQEWLILTERRAWRECSPHPREIRVGPRECAEDLAAYEHIMCNWRAHFILHTTVRITGAS